MLSRSRAFFVFCLALFMGPMALANASFTDLDKLYNNTSPSWWPEYQTIQTDLEDLRVQDARLGLESLLKRYSEDEATFTLLVLRYLWLTDTDGCSFLSSLSPTPEYWLTSAQLFCHFMEEYRQHLKADSQTSSITLLYYWLAGIPTQHTLLAEKTLQSLQAIQVEHDDSLLLMTFISIVKLSGHTPWWQVERDWDHWQEEVFTGNKQQIQTYKNISFLLAKQIELQKLTLNTNTHPSSFPLPGANANLAVQDRYTGTQFGPPGMASPNPCPGPRCYGRNSRAIDADRRLAQERYNQMQNAIKQSQKNAQQAFNNIRNTVNNQVQQNLKNSPYNQANMQQWHQNMHAQGAAETQ
ncbi:MAG: hypothetical protein ACR2PX_04980, partial [Endozoicomonas sp.]|uniref:hypothetical protein n=1 Tax=Endozoicomonas sp. TaxID=1892382 RepID=UPI003D9BCD8E